MAEIAGIINALVGLAIARHKASTVHGKQHIQMHQVHIMNHLVISALEEGGVDSHNRQHALAGKARSKGYGVLFRHANVKKAFRNGVVEEVQASAVFHSCRNGAQVRHFPAQGRQLVAEAVRERILGRHFRICQVIQIKRGNAVELARVFFRRFQTLTLLGDNMQKHRGILFLQVGKDPGQFGNIVAIHRANVLEPHFLEHCGVVDAAADDLFPFLQYLYQSSAHCGDTPQRGFHMSLNPEILWVCA